MPPSVDEFIPNGHLARVISEIADEINTSSIEAKYSAMGQKSYHPRTLLKLWIYGYATGTLSGRKIAILCETDTAYMYLTSMYRPDFRTVNDFRKDNSDFFEECFKTDTDSQLIKCSGLKKPAYNCQGAVSEDGIIVAAYATNKANDKEQLQEVIKQVETNVAEKTGVILVDSGYSSYENYQWLSDQGKTAYIPDQEELASKERLQYPYDKQHFTYQQTTNEYICPQGQILKYTRTVNSHTRKQYYKLYEGVCCSQCSVKEDCTSGR